MLSRDVLNNLHSTEPTLYGVNMAKNVCYALGRLPVASVVVWIDSMIALYWIINPGKSWKVFAVNRVRKIAKIANEVKTEWRYCPSENNIPDLGSRGANLNKRPARPYPALHYSEKG